MVHTTISDTMIKGPYQEVKKGKDERASSGRPQQQQQNSPNKNNKYGSWGSVYKSKQNFIDMHLC